MVVGDEAGLLCDTDNPKALAESLLRLYKDENFHSKVSTASLTAGKRYDRETLAKNA